MPHEQSAGRLGAEQDCDIASLALLSLYQIVTLHAVLCLCSCVTFQHRPA